MYTMLDGTLAYLLQDLFSPRDTSQEAECLWQCGGLLDENSEEKAYDKVPMPCRSKRQKESYLATQSPVPQKRLLPQASNTPV